MDLHERIERVEARIMEACRRSGRSREDVQVIAVTKYVDLDATKRVIEEGFIHIGENRWQDARPKWEALGRQGIWHFIGHLQTNKVKDVIGKFDYIHSLDRISLARELDRKASEMELRVPCFIQVNVSGEESKYGLAPENLMPFVEQVGKLTQLDIIGLMTMAPYEAKSEQTRPVFAGLRRLRDELNGSGLLENKVKHLSMGMSNDFEIAIEEGATWIRLGSVLVGQH
ncbi:YggS family pyridoxal phosphate-dependent enzyme [Ferviditalea candida]|uniref:Pyridoxal phosphate homeostasis protein n=1 Tax=Ferviditalea candida TaxID=3108399 RepID=A0ABU5ZDP8_9BACL|nr:YggS family pyridoxal phosphate-dependent enzyme [Paenibacillaceae bacterium T2]